MTAYDLHVKYTTMPLENLTNLVTAFIMTCAPHLRRGDDMNGRSFEAFKDGKISLENGLHSQRQYLRITLRQLENGHPWIRDCEDMQKANYFHMSKIALINPYMEDRDGKRQVIESKQTLKMAPIQDGFVFEKLPPITVNVTEEMVAEHTVLHVGVAFSS